MLKIALQLVSYYLKTSISNIDYLIALNIYTL